MEWRFFVLVYLHLTEQDHGLEDGRAQVRQILGHLHG